MNLTMNIRHMKWKAKKGPIDEFEGYLGITYENGREHLKYRIESDEFYAIELLDSDGKPV